MIESGSGRIINIGSVSGRIPAPMLGAYHATKYALEAITDALRMELRPFGIGVTIIEPGTIRTAFASRAVREATDARVSETRYAGIYARQAALAAGFDRIASRAGRRRQRDRAAGSEARTDPHRRAQAIHDADRTGEGDPNLAGGDFVDAADRRPRSTPPGFECRGRPRYAFSRHELRDARARDRNPGPHRAPDDRRGTIATPVFMPVGTRGTVRTQTRAQLERLAPPMLLANTYHLMVRPGAEHARAVRRSATNGWAGRVGILTDSGGFQIFSLSGGGSIERGRRRAPQPRRRRRRMLLTPEQSIAMQRAIGWDIMMVARSVHRADQPARAHGRRWTARTAGRAARSPRAATRRRRCSRSSRARCFEELRRESAAVLTGDRRLRRLRDRRSRGRRAARAARGHHRAARPALARRPAALPDGRRHAARHARGRASRRRHVRLHPADRAGSARARVHVARQDRPATRRAPARRAPLDAACDCEACARLLAFVPAPPDQVRESHSAGSCSPTQPPVLSPAHGRHPRAIQRWPVRRATFVGKPVARRHCGLIRRRPARDA